jgi:ADP-ribose pyrophosphatase
MQNSMRQIETHNGVAYTHVAARPKVALQERPIEMAKQGKTRATKLGARKAGPKPKRSDPRALRMEAAAGESEQLLSSEVVFTGPLFRVHHDKLIEPDGRSNERDVIRHNGSVVILAVDNSKSKTDPWVVIERQYRHAAQQYLWELPAGKLDPGEDPLDGARRELAEETGYRARTWKPLVEYFPSPGFLGETMKVFLAEGLEAGQACPEEDESIEFRLVKLSEILKMIDRGAIHDGKTLTTVLLYARIKTSRSGIKSRPRPGSLRTRK